MIEPTDGISVCAMRRVSQSESRPMYSWDGRGDAKGFYKFRISDMSEKERGITAVIKISEEAVLSMLSEILSAKTRELNKTK